jgi:hypothetical protein
MKLCYGERFKRAVPTRWTSIVLPYASAVIAARSKDVRLVSSILRVEIGKVDYKLIRRQAV